jgi:hypothetical protein
MKTVFSPGDLLRFKEDSYWRTERANFVDPASVASLVLVTDSIESSNQFFYGLVCSTGETHLWSHDQFDLVQAASN